MFRIALVFIRLWQLIEKTEGKMETSLLKVKFMQQKWFSDDVLDFILFPKICRSSGKQCKQNVSGDAYFEFPGQKGHIRHNDSV
jgi:hypothetical protein